MEELTTQENEELALLRKKFETYNEGVETDRLTNEEFKVYLELSAKQIEFKTREYEKHYR